MLRALPDSALRSIGIPPAALSACRIYDSFLGDSVIGRFDFALTATGPKVLELNAETPFFLWESHEIAGATGDLAQRGIWFDATERATIARHFLPTYLDLPADNDTYVRKPVFGREGNSVSIVRGGTTLANSDLHDYRAQPAVHQALDEMLPDEIARAFEDGL